MYDFTLAKFQVNASKRLLSSLERKKRTGTIISAGTGGGKTLAFYLPALAQIAANIERSSNNNWMQCLSLYPRTELLKNQFSDVYKEELLFSNF